MKSNKRMSAVHTARRLPARKPVWSLAHPASKAQRSGRLRAPSNSDLIEAAQSQCRDGRARLVDLRPVICEVSRRVKRHQIPGIRTQTELCARLGCSRRWLELIVSGDWKYSNRHKAKGATKHAGLGGAAKLQSDDEFANDIARFAAKKLDPLVIHDWPRSRAVCKLLQDSFAGAAQRSNP